MLVQLNIRAEKLLKEICQKEAEKEARTLSSFVIHALMVYLREHRGIDYIALKKKAKKSKK